MQDKQKPIPQQQQLNIEIGEAEAEGIYSNLAIISHSQAEFVVDFTRVMPGAPKAKVHARIIMTPQHAKLLARALEDNIHKYEQKNGEIILENPGSNMFPGFSGGTPKVN